MTDEKLMLLNFIIAEYKDIMSDITLNEVVSKQYDDEVLQSKTEKEFLILEQKVNKAKDDFKKRINYLEGKADAYEAILLKLNINPDEKF
jgi:hypothetical protein